MTGSDALFMLLGAALVSTGFLGAALAERIRGYRAETVAPTVQEPLARVPASRRPRGTHRARAIIPVVAPGDLLDQADPEPVISAEFTEGDDVIAALVATGYKKALATEATWACSTSERSTVETWTAAALRRCARGGVS